VLRLRYHLTALLLIGAALAGPASAQTEVNPLAGLTFYNDPDSPSWQSYRHLSRSGQDAKAALVHKIASQPKAVWVGKFTRPNFRVKVRRIFDSAQAQGAVPVLTVLRAESIRCAPDYQGGGPTEDRATRAWYDDLAAAIGNDRAVIAFEPDSLGTIDCHAKSRRDDRIALLRYGVETLSRLPGVSLYIEAGASDWEPAARTANQLRAVGIAQADGFMLNATHYDWTAANIKHGLEISRRVGGKHFIINTAENGRGPVHYRRGNGRRITVWCNPGLRGLGPPPTTATSHPKVDAYLWINRPGYAQRCQGRTIAWFLPRALSYARYATDWERPPAGTRFGHHARFPLRAFGIPR
jgi:endoglucanase